MENKKEEKEGAITKLKCKMCGKQIFSFSESQAISNMKVHQLTKHGTYNDGNCTRID